MTFRHKLNRFGRRPVDRFTNGQSNRYPRPLADPTADVDLALVPLHQAPYDLHVKPGPIGLAAITRAGLKNSFPHSRKIVLLNSDTGIFDRHHQLWSVTQRTDGDASPARCELDGV